MHVGIDASAVLDEQSGVEAHVVASVESLAAHSDVELTVFVRQRPPARWASLASRLTTVALPSKSQAKATQVDLPLAVRRVPIDVLYCPAKPPPALTRVPVLAAAHDAVPWTLPGTMGRGAAAWYRTFTAIAVRRGAHVATVSEASAAQLARCAHIPRPRLHVIGNTLPPWLAGPPPTPAAASSPYLLSVCRIEPRKDLPTVLDAWDVLRRRHPDLRLALVGKPGWKVEQVVARAAATPGVELLGHVGDDELRSLYSGAAAFVTASIEEGFGLPVLEAMHLGAPVIASKISAHIEVAGDAAAYCPVGDANGLADAVTSLVADPARAAELRRAGLARAAEWSPQRFASRLERALEASAGG
jgi:glycosyltransferase involved in cell wall biosynthesis